MWTAEYFDNLTLTGLPVLTGQVATIAYNWGDAAPDPALPADGFAVRWTLHTVVRGPFAQRYALGARTQGGLRMYVDGALVVDRWVDTVHREVVYGMLGVGEHVIVVEFMDESGPAAIEVVWRQPARLGEPILMPLTPEVQPRGPSARNRSVPQGY